MARAPAAWPAAWPAPDDHRMQTLRMQTPRDDPPLTRHVAVRVPGWGPSRAPAAQGAAGHATISPRSPALFSRRSVLGLCGIPRGAAEYDDPSFVTNISTRSPALFSRRSVLGLCGIPPGDAGEAWLRMSRETPLFVIVADHIVMASAPPPAVRAELDGRQLAAGQALPLRHKSVIEVRYAEVVHAACTRWTLLFSAQYAHRRKNDHHLRVRFADGT
jgi:hypothetical protein